jgi:hypothetical protein
VAYTLVRAAGGIGVAVDEDRTGRLRFARWLYLHGRIAG